jgi:hypothetical protein
MKKISGLLTAILSFAFTALPAQPTDNSTPAGHIMHVVKCMDFALTGDGTEAAWRSAQWTDLKQQQAGALYSTQFKIMYSDSGIYCLYQCMDSAIVSTLKGDFLDLWHEDVVEAFFWTDERIPVYFEYELSPLNYELPIMVPNYDGNFYGWRPWHYEGKRLTRHAVAIKENTNHEGNSWTAEFYIPYLLLKPVISVPPARGSRWRANFYRIDYDRGQSEWSWLPVPGTFHDYKRFRTLEFR